VRAQHRRRHERPGSPRVAQAEQAGAPSASSGTPARATTKATRRARARPGLGLALAPLAAFVAAAPAAAQTPTVESYSVGLAISWEECRARVARALAAEGYTDLADSGNGWEGKARGGTASVGCFAGTGQTILTVVTTGASAEFRLIPERMRLLDRIRGDAAPATAPATPLLGEGWAVTAESVRGRNRQRFAVSCPPGGNTRAVWGSDLYTDDSSVCTAGVHAGAITTRAGGRVSIEIRPGADSYRGVNRNGVRSQDFEDYQGSFVVVPNAPESAIAPTGGAGWNATAARLRGRIGERFGFACPAGGVAGGVWGTDVYTDESSVCAAAVHAGVISIAGGGSVLIEVRAGAESYRGTTRGGVVSEGSGPSPGSFVFVR
jgi:hypothetical protein